MNQAIQFPDREEWIDARAAICFPAFHNGMQLTCAISGETLARRFGGDTPQAWLCAFQTNRWDLEEEAEQRILQQEDDDQGWFWLP